MYAVHVGVWVVEHIQVACPECVVVRWNIHVQVVARIGIAVTSRARVENRSRKVHTLTERGVHLRILVY